MEIYRIWVDEYPESCGECPLAKSIDYRANRGSCTAMQEGNNDICTAVWAKFLRQDCPLVKAEKAGDSEC